MGYTVLGMIYHAQGNLAEAKKAFDLALQKDPKNAKAYFEIGKSYEKTDISKAKKYFQKSLDAGELDLKDILYATEKSI